MTGAEVIAKIKEERGEKDHFIKWWRKENDFTDYELIDSFIENTPPGLEFGGFELLGMEELWDFAKRLDPAHLKRGKEKGAEVIYWERPEKEGASRNLVCPYIPESLLSIVDVETKGNPID